MGIRTRIAVITLAAVGFASCSTTVDETGDPNDPTQQLSEAELTGGEGRVITDDDTSPLDPEVIVDIDAPETTIAVAGTAADLLPDIGIDMSQLSAQIGDDGDEDATIARIEASWAAIKAEVESTHPQLVNSIQATVDMARTAVDSNRPADADKAFGLLTDLIDAFTGDN